MLLALDVLGTKWLAVEEGVWAGGSLDDQSAPDLGGLLASGLWGCDSAVAVDGTARASAVLDIVTLADGVDKGAGASGWAHWNLVILRLLGCLRLFVADLVVAGLGLGHDVVNDTRIISAWVPSARV